MRNWWVPGEVCGGTGEGIEEQERQLGGRRGGGSSAREVAIAGQCSRREVEGDGGYRRHSHLMHCNNNARSTKE